MYCNQSVISQVGQLFPQVIPPANTLIGSSISRILPKDSAKNLAKDVFRAIHPSAENVDVARMMGRWFQVSQSISMECRIAGIPSGANMSFSHI